MIVTHELFLFEYNESRSLIIDLFLLAESEFQLLVFKNLNLLVTWLPISFFLKHVGLHISKFLQPLLSTLNHQVP